MFKRKGTPSSSKSSSPVPMDLDFENEIQQINPGNFEQCNEEMPTPHPIEVNITYEDDLEDPNPVNLSDDTELNPGIHYEYTKNHPLGDILLKLLAENTKLAKKVNLKTMEMGVGDLCTQFYEGR